MITASQRHPSGHPLAPLRLVSILTTLLLLTDSPCCCQNLLFTNATASVASALSDSSGGLFGLDRAGSLMVNFTTSVRASTSGCFLERWEGWALGNLSNVNGPNVLVSNYTFR
jgi:hypothetical protein